MLRPMRPRFPPLAAWLAAAGALVIASRPARAQADTARAAARPDTSATRPVHFRVLGVFDEETGEPIEGADVSDMLTHLTTRTTKTGTAAVFFADTGGTVVTIKKLGYQPALLAVPMSLADSTPVTTTLLRMGHLLPTIVVVGGHAVWLGKSDTSTTLRRDGFYERRLTSAAPSTAFITGDKIQGLMLVSDAHYFGRGICEGNVYIDGVHVLLPRRTGHVLNEGIDALVSPFDVAGIETYTTTDLPAGAPHTDPGAGALDIGASMAAAAMANASGTIASSGCVTFIWLTR
ncbi:MAG TPA: hypothetical protein VNE60_04485 [Gemmatimonadaceae bacterium]|nr:hypothetical protein [Gemmatimonadaceae bacterium]